MADGKSYGEYKEALRNAEERAKVEI